MANEPTPRLTLAVDLPDDWAHAVDVPALERAALLVAQDEGLSGAVEVGLIFVDDEDIRELNARYRGLDRPTDVLSFGLREGEEPDEFVLPPDIEARLGDIVISYPRAVSQAEEYGHSVAREVGYLFVHGLLHLLGYDHETEEDKAVMREKEESALAAIGLVR